MMRWIRRILIALCAAALLTAAAVAILLYVLVAMPGDPLRGGLPPPDSALIAQAARLRAHVDMLATGIGERHAERMPALDAAADYIQQQLRSYGYITSERRF